MPNLHISKNDVGHYAILTGSLERVDLIAQQMDKAKKVAQHREYITVSGYFRDVKLTVTSTGIGAPSAAIALEELVKLGVGNFIRIGTSGSLQEEVKVGDLIIATGAIRDEGTSSAYVPLYYPAVAHVDIVWALRESARQLNREVKLGLVHCKDALKQETPAGFPLEAAINEKWTVLRKANVLCTEMESSALFVVGAIRKVRVGAIILSAGLTYQGEPDIENELTDQGMVDAIGITLQAFTILEEQEQALSG
jgi:uridine phosphorylase